MRFRHLTIVGVGLIGGSFALAARRAGLAEIITGVDSADVLDRALALGVIDDRDEAFETGRVSDADLVYLAAPVGAIVGFLRTHGNQIKAGAIVTDGGSTKREICRAARESLSPAVAFVGGHPMAGTHNAGIEFADADLFRSAPYALVAGDSTRPDAVREIIDVVKSIGAKPISLTAEEHDRIAARVSHAPQLLSTALALAAAKRGNQEAITLAGSGFAEMTRLAASRWSVWEDICRSNADEISAALDESLAEIEALRAALVSGDFSGLGEMFNDAGDLARGFHKPRRPR